MQRFTSFIFLTVLLLIILVTMPTGVHIQHCWSLEKISGFEMYLTNPATGSMASAGLWKKECRLKSVKRLELWWGRDEGNKDAKKIHGFEQLLARDACEWLALQNLLLSKGLQGSLLQAPSHFLTLNC